MRPGQNSRSLNKVRHNSSSTIVFTSSRQPTPTLSRKRRKNLLLKLLAGKIAHKKTRQAKTTTRPLLFTVLYRLLIWVEWANQVHKYALRVVSLQLFLYTLLVRLHRFSRFLRKRTVTLAPPSNFNRIVTLLSALCFRTAGRVAQGLYQLTYPFTYTARHYHWQAVLSLLLSAGMIYGTYLIHEHIFVGLPTVSELTTTEPVVSSKILDRNGKVLFRLYDEENRTIIPLNEIPPHLILATIAIEDRDFFEHRGFSLRGITRALLSNSRGEPIQGGSTITQQLVKNRLLSSERTMTRKIRELLLAIMVEQSYSKEQILEMYLNQVAYGGSAYGVEEAAQKYFGKSVTKLSLAEATLLAGLPQSPSIYSPHGSNPELALHRQREVLRRMVEDGYISQERADLAAAEKLAFRQDVIDIQAPHFVMYIKKLLAEKYGEEALYQGGLEVRTSLDLDLQTQVQTLVSEEIKSLARLNVSNGAALVTNPNTGEILSMVGSKNYFDFMHDGQVNVTIRPRQPGSSIKPLTYAVALEKGYLPNTLIDDSPITYRIAGSPPYSPKNYDGRFRGTVTLREALGSSYNIPAVKILAHLGLSTIIDKAEEVGITTWKDRNRFGLSLTLGGGEVLMTDMAELYGTFATGGYTVDLDPILEVSTYKGEVLYRNSCALDGVGCYKYKAFNETVAYLITHILSDNSARTPAFGPFSTLYIPNQEVAVKTGTTNNLRDNWTFGYTSDRVVAVWVGNNDNTPMSYVASGVTGASAIWNKAMRLLLDPENPHAFVKPENVISVAGCAGPTPSCPTCRATREELYPLGRQPATPCSPSEFRKIPETATANSRILEGATVQ